jgi:hypothetical protein
MGGGMSGTGGGTDSGFGRLGGGTGRAISETGRISVSRTGRMGGRAGLPGGGGCGSTSRAIAPAACACGTARISGVTGRPAFLGGSCSARGTGGAACVGAHRTTRAHSFRGRGAAVARPGAQVDDRGLLAVGGEIAQGRHRQARGGPGEIREAHDPGACVLGSG